MFNENEAFDQQKQEAPKHEYPQRIRFQLRHEASALGEQKARTDRALEILGRHPEFEELLELIGLIGTPIRIPAQYAVKPLVTK